MFQEISREIEGGSYDLIARCSGHRDGGVANSLTGRWSLALGLSCPTSVQRWMPFKETSAQLAEARQEYKLVLLSEPTTSLLG